MTRVLLAILLALPLAAPLATSAQDANDPALDGTAAAFEADVARVARLATAAVLVHERTGAFPTDAFGILGADEGAQTGARALSLSALDVTTPSPEATAAGAVGAFTVVPLPDPYVRDDTPVRVVILRRADGLYEAQYRITRQRDGDLGGGRLPYDTAGRYRVENGLGVLCIDPAMARAMTAAGAFVADPTRLSAEPFTVRVVPPGDDAPLYYQTTRSR